MIRLAVLSLFGISLFAWNPEEQPNVNSRYTVESVHLSGKRTSRLSEGTRHEIETIVGQKLDHGLLDQIASRIKKELRVEGVAIHVAKGTRPEQVTVEFAVEGGRRHDFDIDIPKGVYHSRQGWSGGIETTTTFGSNSVGLGVISDGDSSVERFAGIRSRYERDSLGTDRVRLRVEFDSYHQQWNEATIAARTTSHFSPDLYRSRQHIEPSVTFVLAQGLTLTAGVSIDRLQPQIASLGTAGANAAISSLRYHRKWDGDLKQEFDAAYSLRAATGALASDFVYSRHTWNLSYRLGYGHNTMTADFLAGRIAGRAPLFDRFVLGTGGTLRGWNKYDLDPLGGDRVVHGSAGYGYRGLQVFYDTGAVWDSRTGADRKQSAGIGFGSTGKDGFLIAMAFPLRTGHIDPMFIVGFNF